MKEVVEKFYKEEERKRFGEMFALFLRKDQIYHRWCGQTTLTWSIFLTLDYLYREKAGQAPSKLADELNIPRQTMTSVLDSLEEMELTERRNHGSDRRKKIVLLSDKGIRYTENLFNKLHEGELRAYSTLDAKEQEMLNRLFDRFITALEMELEE